MSETHVPLMSRLLKEDANCQCKHLIYLKNWRSLTLLCCDTRILSKCIATRIKGINHSIIDMDKSGFIEGRLTGEGIRHQN